jgi:hypothetical protein
MRCFIPDCLHTANYQVWTTNKRRSMCFGHAVVATRTRGHRERLWTP